MKRLAWAACGLLSVICGAATLPLTPEAWDNQNPLGGTLTGTAYACPEDASQGFALSKTAPCASNIVLSATLVPRATLGGSFKTAALCLYENPKRFWHMALAETPQGAPFFELNEMRDGVWLSQSSLKIEANVEAGTWTRGARHDVSIALDGTGCEGVVKDAAGKILFRRRFRLKPGAVGCGRPALKYYGFSLDYTDVASAWSNEVPAAVVAETAKVLPPYATPKSVVAAAAGERLPGTGFFRTAKDAEGRWRFVDPAGFPFFMAAASTVSHMGDHNAKLGYAPYGRNVQRKYKGDMEAWGRAAVDRLESWGFNAVCGATAPAKYKGLPHSFIVGIGNGMASCGDANDILPSDGGPCTAFPNVFSPRWPAYCRFMAEKYCRPNRDDPWLIGYFIDNELSWWGDARKFRTPPARGLFDAAAAKGDGHSAKRALVAFLKARGVDAVEKASDADRLEFVRLCARKYFEVAAQAIRAADPNHLVLGCRYAGLRSSHPVVWEECAKSCDVVSANIYPVADLDRKCVYAGSGRKAQKIEDQIRDYMSHAGDKPLVVTEWSFSALDSGRPCLHGAGQRFFTQRERAEAVSLFARTMMGLPCMAGYVFFKWSDQPVCGRKNELSENTNYGLVTETDEPYPEVTRALADLQLNSAKWRRTPPPQPVPTSAGAPADRRALAAAVPGADAPSFARRADGSFVFTNGRVRFEGAPGRGLLVNGKGVSSATVREYSRGHMWWSGASDVVSAEATVADGVGALDVTFGGKLQSGAPFRVKERFYLPAGRAFYYMEHLAVLNPGTKPFPVDELFFRLLPVPELRKGTKEAPDATRPPPKDGQPTPIPPTLWRPWQCGAWLCDEDRLCLALVAPRASEVNVRFWDDPDRDSLHADASFHFGKAEVAPGGAFTPPGRPFVAGAAVEGGLAAWAEVFAEIRDVQVPDAVSVKVDFTREAGRVKPMHAVGQPPVLGPRDYQLFRYLKEAGIPYSRLHDIGSSVPQARAHMVDIPNVFPDFDADETKPENYDFTYTDKLLAALRANGVEPWFRLGVSIENDCRVKAYNILPPKDYAKWARICEHVIRHYTEGWADGYKWKIDYWEIWNEPDNRKDPLDNQQWRGTFPEFCELYAVASRHLKACFPHLKIGGYGSCGYRLLSTPEPKRDDDMRHRVACIGAFLSFARARDLPLDFFSYHSYLAPSDTVDHVAIARKALDDAGYAHTELSLNEWLPNPRHAKLGTAEQAAEICAEMLGLQATRLDSAMIYDARCGLGSFSPLFNPFTYRPHKAFYALKAFNELYRLGTSVAATSSAPCRVWTGAAKGPDGGAVVVAHTGDRPVPLDLDLGGRKVRACRLTDADRTDAPVALPAVLPPHSFLVVLTD